ncbi:IS200/IS605 family transposase [Echinicola strongylocentroti]|uniref:IS200/IS605 family transposase n=1 Tax=Echinicola strongylocentroti TaxID=1795355 RepID=A0A2Z4IJM2_9BACT|nr:IS200/IS605 family transposase [Echinicola strongylocentroti]AWW30603.1 IS200/IS605 family transposase [Echinicola strongylocentroti]
MPNTYTQIHIQCVFAVKYRRALIHPSWKERLHKYIIGVINNQGHKTLSINSMPDHLHVFFGMRPTQSLSDLMRLVKGESSEWINKNLLVRGKFRWQDGYGAFSYSKSQTDAVVNYILNQEKHHQKKTFLEEYKEMLAKFQVEYDDQYVFKELE